MALEKRPRAGVRDIATARGRKGRGRPAGLGFDPTAGEDVRGATYKDSSGDDGEFDVFTLVDERGYRPDRFYTRSVNADGHGERMQVRVPQGIDSQILGVIKDVAQYRSPQDFWRDAALHRLEWLQHNYTISDSLRRFLELERMQADSDQAVDEVRTMKASVERLGEALGEHYEAGDWQMFADELIRGDERAEWLREPYRAKALHVLKEWRTRGRAALEKMERDKGE